MRNETNCHWRKTYRIDYLRCGDHERRYNWGVMLDRLVLADFSPLSNMQKAAEPDFKLMSEAWGIISKRYVDRQALQAKKLTYGAISGMVNSLGDTGHSTFLSPEMLSYRVSFLKGQFQWHWGTNQNQGRPYRNPGADGRFSGSTGRSPLR